MTKVAGIVYLCVCFMLGTYAWSETDTLGGPPDKMRVCIDTCQTLVYQGNGVYLGTVDGDKQPSWRYGVGTWEKVPTNQWNQQFGPTYGAAFKGVTLKPFANGKFDSAVFSAILLPDGSGIKPHSLVIYSAAGSGSSPASKHFTAKWEKSDLNGRAAVDYPSHHGKSNVPHTPDETR